jgi:minor histocompatibility antigen H13
MIREILGHCRKWMQMIEYPWGIFLKDLQLLTMSSPGPLMEWVGRFAFEAARLRPFLPTYLHLVASALFPIYIGAHASLSLPSSAAPPAERKNRALDGDSADEEPEVIAEKIEGLTPKDAVLFPLLAGFTLSSLYFIIKWLEDPTMLNKILSYYFMQVGVFFGTKFLKDAFTVVRSFCLPNQYAQGGLVWKVNKLKQRYDAVGTGFDTTEAHHHVSPFPGHLGRLPLSKSITDQIWRIRGLVYAKCSLNFHIHKLITLKVPVDFLDALALSTSLAVVGVFTFIIKPWYVSNLLGFAFCYGSAQYMSPTTFWTGTLLLSALFFYDIYFVFFTPMMVTVATKLDIPIKLLFPRPPSPAEIEKGSAGFAMLGLGDIVIPGMMVALALRFDLYLHYLRKPKTIEGKLEKATYVPVTGGWGERFWVGRSAAGDLQAKAFPKTYFKAGLIGYALGMIVTLLVMQVSEHAQPALLYLVPGVLIALWGTAAMKGEVHEMWRYTEDKEANKEEDSSKGEDSKATLRIEEKKGKLKGLPKDEDSAVKIQANDARDNQPQSGPVMENEEMAPTFTATDDDIDGASDPAAVSGTPSESTSGSESSSDSGRSSHSQQEKHSKQSAAKKSKKEQNCRHLVWFSIGFPPAPPSAEQPASKSLLGNADNKGVSEKKKKGSKKTVDGIVKLMDGEPPGKRRRVK